MAEPGGMECYLAIDGELPASAHLHYYHRRNDIPTENESGMLGSVAYSLERLFAWELNLRRTGKGNILGHGNCVFVMNRRLHVDVVTRFPIHLRDPQVPSEEPLKRYPFTESR